MDDVYFFMVANKLKVSKKSNLESIYMSAKFGEASISISGDIDNNFIMSLEEFLYKGDSVTITDSQRGALERVFNKEVENVFNSFSEAQEEREELEEDYMQYGQEGAIYGKFY